MTDSNLYVDQKMIFVTLISQFRAILSECSVPGLLYPCKCVHEEVSCGGNQCINLKHIFDSLSQQLMDGKKHFKGFEFNNTAITLMEENTFLKITFDYIEVLDAVNLTSMHTNAFSENTLVTSFPVIRNTPIKDLNICNMFRLIKNAYRIGIFGIKLTEI